MKPLYVIALAFSLFVQLTMVLSCIHEEPGYVAVVRLRQEPVYYETAAITSDDSHFSKQWAMSNIMVFQAWGRSHQEMPVS